MLLPLTRRLVRYICLALLAALIVTPALQIVMRGVFNVPMSGAEELARYFLICLTLFGGSYVTLESGQIRMEEFQAILPEYARWLLQMFIDIAGAAMFTVMAVAALVSISNNLSNQTATLEMPFWLFMGPLALGAILLVVETTAQLVRTWRNGRADAKQTTLT